MRGKGTMAVLECLVVQLGWLTGWSLAQVIMHALITHTSVTVIETHMVVTVIETAAG